MGHACRGGWRLVQFVKQACCCWSLLLQVIDLLMADADLGKHLRLVVVGAGAGCDAGLVQLRLSWDAIPGAQRSTAPTPHCPHHALVAPLLNAARPA